MPDIIAFCRELRQRETPAEKILWEILRNRRFFGYKFLRQHPIFISTAFKRHLYYIPDFYCHSAKLVIEADGPIHLLKKHYDNNRDEVLTQLGLKILRFENESIINYTDHVRETISLALGVPLG